MPSTYSYSEAFERLIVAVCLRDVSFVRDYEDCINPNYFDYDYLTSILKVYLNVRSRQDGLPSHAFLHEEIKEFCASYHVSDSAKVEILEQLAELYRITIVDGDAIRNKVISFGKQQAMKLAIMELADLVDKKGDHSNAIEIITKAVTVGENVNSLGLQLVGQFSQIPTIARNAVQYGTRGQISTGIPRLDAATIPPGGPGTNQVWVVIGVPGSGKSQWLCHIGSIAVTRGFCVVHITIGDLDEIDVGVRYSARLAHVSMIDVINNTDEYARKAKNLDRWTQRYLKVRYYSAASVTPQTIRAYLSKLITIDRVQPKLLIVDYPDEFKPYTSDNTYQNMGRVYSELSAIAADYHLLVWAASQPQRYHSSGDDDVLTMDKIADSWLKAAKSDGIVTLNQTPSEYEQNRMRLWVEKVRRGRKQFLVKMHFDPTMCFFRELQKEEREEHD